jgi:hypothetical protein
MLLLLLMGSSSSGSSHMAPLAFKIDNNLLLGLLEVYLALAQALLMTLFILTCWLGSITNHTHAQYSYASSYGPTFTSADSKIEHSL